MTRRASISRAKRVRIFDAAGGVCHLCRQPIQQGEKWEVEHPIARGLNGSDAEKDLRPAHAECHKPKTKADKKKISKAVRVRANYIGAKKPTSRPIPQRPKTERAPGKVYKLTKTPDKLAGLPRRTFGL